MALILKGQSCRISVIIVIHALVFLGEHIDYCGYSVLPMAIEQDVVIAVATTESQDILLSNVKSDLYRYE